MSTIRKITAMQYELLKMLQQDEFEITSLVSGFSAQRLIVFVNFKYGRTIRIAPSQLTWLLNKGLVVLHKQGAKFKRGIREKFKIYLQTLYFNDLEIHSSLRI